MENKDVLTGEKLLMLLPQENSGMNIETGEDVNTHQQKNIIPPVGIAKPELVESFMENIQDENKIKQSIKEIEDYYRENPLETVEREVKSHGLRALEGLGGTVGGFLNLLSGEGYFNDQGELVEHEVPTLPSADVLRERSKETFGGKYEPKTKLSKFTQEVATDIGANLPFLRGALQKLLLPLGSNLAKFIAVNQGLSENKAELFKDFMMMGSTIANIGNAPKIASNAYAEARQMIPAGTRMASRQITRGLNNIKTKPWYRTGRTQSKSPAMDEIERIEKKIQQGSMDVQDAMQLRKDISEARKRLGAFLAEPGIDKGQARKYLDEVDEVLLDGLETYGRQNNPNWWKAYKESNKAYEVTQRSRHLQEFIESHAITKGIQSPITKTAFHLGGASAIASTPSLLAGLAPGLAAAKGIQILNRMIRSPVLRNHYLEVLKAASEQNAGALNRALQKFDDEAAKLDKNQKS